MRKNLILFFAGALMDLALAPFYIFPVLLVSFPIFYKALVSVANKREAFWRGWWFGFGYFVFGLYWISNSLLVDLRFAWLIPFAITLIPAACGVFTGLVGLVFWKIKKPHPLLLVVLWVFAEYLRGMFPFGGFPWNNIGYAALFSVDFAQIASIGGIYFVSLVVMFLALLPVYYKERKQLTLAVIIIIGSFVYGFLHLGGFEVAGQKNAKTIAIIQPNIKQTLKWDPVYMRLNFLDTLELAKQSKADITIWPESSVPYRIGEEFEVLKMISEVTPQNGVTVTSSTRENADRFFNSMFVIAPGNNIITTYDKHHLVPFGEYVPMRSVLPVEKVTGGMVDFSAGEKGKVLEAQGLKFLPLICYEIIFPEYAKGNYDFIVNITNDAWFGNSTGPRQHLAMARMRAIEQGRPTLRAANTGISAIIDANGRIVQSLEYGKKGMITSIMPMKISTIYSMYGNFIYILASFCIIIFLMEKVNFNIKRQ